MTATNDTHDRDAETDAAELLEAEAGIEDRARRPKRKQKPSHLEERFLRLWTALRGPMLQREYHFHKGRRWRADFAHPEARVLIEIEGGIWSRGRHVTPRGFQADAEKYLAATLDGWTVLRLTHAQLNIDALAPIIGYVRQRLPQ